MSDLNFNDKSFKPTLKPASSMGKNIDNQFKSKMKNVGVNMSTIKEEAQKKEKSLKKKIFSLPKMETLIMTDDYLSNIYNKLKQDASELYGYHWNETIVNMIFNDHVLNDAAYLQKYKNTQTYNKKRRGEEGVQELEKNLQDKIDTSDKKPEFNRTKKMGDIETNKESGDQLKRDMDKSNTDESVNELFGFGKPQTAMATTKPSKNDTYFVDKGNNTAVGVLSANNSAEQNQEVANKFAGNTLKYARMPWYVAVQNKVKGVPTQVTDGSVNDFQQSTQKYAGVPSLAEESPVAETTTAASSGAFTQSLNVADKTYQNETTTSASSGAFVGPFPAKRKAVLDKPLWVGGTILREGADYLTSPEALMEYVKKCEDVDKLEEMMNENIEEAGLSMKQHAMNILGKLKRMETENPELSKLPEFQEIVSMYDQQSKAADQPVQQQQPQQQKPAMAGADTTHQWKASTNEEPNHEGALKMDLENTGRHVAPNPTLDHLQKQDGLFKGKWNTNEGETITNNNKINEGMEQQVQQPAQQEDIFSKIADLVFPDSVKSATELNALGQDFYKRFLSKVSPQEAYRLLYDKSKTMKESMIDDQPDSMARTMDSPELNTSGAPTTAAAPMGENQPVPTADDVSNQGDRQDKEAIADSAKFRQFLMSKYGVDSVASLNPAQKRQVMKDMAANNAQPAAQAAPEKSLDVKNFAATDAQKALYNDRDSKQLGYIAAKNPTINTMDDYLAMEKAYGAEMGEKMFHPMAILASIQKIEDPTERMKYSNIERVLTGRMGGVSEGDGDALNEERLTPSQLNLQNIKKQTAALTSKDMADADALKQAKVYPNPDEFYIEQDDAKVQQFKTSAELEAAALDKVKAAQQGFDNVGNSTNENGHELQKRNLSKEEMTRLAMDRGDGMHNIVYDNKPSEKFEKRLEKDMGAEQYKLRQEKMTYREDAPMFNKDTQPTEKGLDKEQDNKFKAGFNEAFTGKYVDEIGRTKLVEFVVSEVEEVESINEGFKLNLEGLGNKFTVKINENELYQDVVDKYDFYLIENKVVKVKLATSSPSTVNESALDKMNHLIGYKSNDYVNTKKSVRF